MRRPKRSGSRTTAMTSAASTPATTLDPCATAEAADLGARHSQAPAVCSDAPSRRVAHPSQRPVAWTACRSDPPRCRSLARHSSSSRMNRASAATTATTMISDATVDAMMTMCWLTYPPSDSSEPLTILTHPGRRPTAPQGSHADYVGIGGRSSRFNWPLLTATLAARLPLLGAGRGSLRHSR